MIIIFPYCFSDPFAVNVIKLIFVAEFHVQILFPKEVLTINMCNEKKWSTTLKIQHLFSLHPKSRWVELTFRRPTAVVVCSNTNRVGPTRKMLYQYFYNPTKASVYSLNSKLFVLFENKRNKKKSFSYNILYFMFLKYFHCFFFFFNLTLTTFII